MKVVIAAGGKGTRIQSVASDIPKPLIPIDGVPVLEREIISLRNQGFTDIIITVSYLHKLIENYFGDGTRLGVNLEYFLEKTPLGNAGALFKIQHLLTEDFIFLIADVLFDIDFNRFVAYHRKKGGLVTLFTHPNSHPYDSSILVADEDGAVERWLTKEDTRPEYYKNCVNAGIHIINPAVFDICGIDGDRIGKEMNGKIVKVDLDCQILKPMCGTGKMFCYYSPEYCKDMGTPDRFISVTADLRSGVIKAKNLRNKQKAVFLDRDGTINKHIGFVRKPEEFELLPDVAEAIKRINSSGYLAIVITNQPVIARGEVTWAGLQEIHNKMETLLGAEGAYLDGLYYCPHHPHKGYEGEIPEMKIDCDCRKPNPGLIFHAAEDFNVELSESWMIGDSSNDIGAGKNAGCRTVLIGDEKFGQNLTCSTLLEAIDKILVSS